MNAVLSEVKRSVGADSSRDASESIAPRLSQELVFAMSGPVGCGLSHVRGVLESTLRDHGYQVVVIKITEHLVPLATELGVPVVQAIDNSEFERVSNLQDLGNRLRKVVGDDLGAQVAIGAIASDRAQKHPGIPVEQIKPGRVAYIIDQLKNPKEATLLRGVYGNLFYLVGVLAGYERRRTNLVSSMSGPQAETLIERDRAESGGGGQQLEKTLKLADFFVRNSHDNTEELAKPLGRFVGLVHGKNGSSPTVFERGMYAAFSAGLRSACLSRQVGASVLDINGNLVATGCNDVPSAGGGLYGIGATDHRCVFKEGGKCFNDKHKDKLRDEIARILEKENIAPERAKEIAQKIRGETRLKDLIEFSRAVHAEMDALVSAARNGGVAVQDCLLFTTTYPCHNCARHIVAAGISAVYFIEPYGKSLASELHSDSISHDSDSDNASRTRVGDAKRVAFLHFEGVAPRRFSDLFNAADSRKDSMGMANRYNPTTAAHKSPELLDNYRELEGRIWLRLKEKKSSGGPAVA